MKTHQELFFYGTSDDLKCFFKDLENNVKGDWTVKKTTAEFFAAEYTGQDVSRAVVFISLSDHALQSGKTCVGNITPVNGRELSIDEYNSVLKKFDEDIIDLCRKNECRVRISDLTSDEFDPLTQISEDALRKLEAFCNLANKQTGSAHPSDQKRWLEFICQTVEDHRLFDYNDLIGFLQDKSYWKTFGPWDKEMAEKLAEEYSFACRVLNFYRSQS